MFDVLLPILFAIFLWWGTTGLIIYADGLPNWTFKWTFAASSIAASAALIAISVTMNEVGTTAVYIAFASGVALWVWQETAFYMGYLTGPRKAACPNTCGGVRHFWHGVETVLWHQIAALAGFAALWLLLGGAENQVALWTYAVLWLMQQSAKINVFFGVRNLNLEFLPQHLRYLIPFMSRRSFNAFFPVSILVSGAVLGAAIHGLAALPATAPATLAAGGVMIATLLALAILEHLALMVPIPADRLWDWSLASHQRHRPQGARVAATSPATDRAATEVSSQPGDWSAEIEGSCDRDRLHRLLDGVAQGGFGDITELGGIVRAGPDWVRIGVRDGAATIVDITPEPKARSRAFATGARFDSARLQAAFQACIIRPFAA